MVTLLIVGDRGYIAYVGDSRIYLLRGGIVYQLTEDHSLMNELIRQGKITAEAFDDSPYAQFKHAMTRAVGPNESVEVDTLDFDMIPGDSFLLCSDGLYEYLDDSDISRMLSLTEIKDIPGRLIDMANTRGGKDNITALIIQVPENADGSDRAAEINFTLDTLKSIPLFASLTYQQLVRIMNLTRIVPFDQGDVLCYEGDPAEALFVILRGGVELESGGTKVAALSEGSHFGEMALIDTSPRSATATATEAGKVLLINREDFFEILRKEAPLAVKLLWAFIQELTSRLRTTNEELSDARSQDLGEISDEIVDLSEEILISESSSEMSRAELGVALTRGEDSGSKTGAPIREASDTVMLDTADLEVLEVIEGVEGVEEVEEDEAGDAAELSESTAPTQARGALSLDAEAARAADPLRTTLPNLGNQSAGRFGTAAADSGFDFSDDDDDTPTRATRPTDAVTDDP